VLLIIMFQTASLLLSSRQKRE